MQTTCVNSQTSVGLSRNRRIYGRSRIAIIAASVVFLIHLVCNPHYGFFGDELYFIVCGQHPQLNYVDVPPVAPLLAAASQVFGPSLVLLRAVPALFAAAGIFVTCLLVTELGGAAYAQVLSAIAVFFLPVLTDFGMKVSPDMVGLWSWPLITLWVVRLTKGANRRLWVAIGVLMGLSILSKYSVLFFAAALLAGLLLTPQRRILYSWWFVAATVISAAMALPAFLWQVHYGYPMLQLLRAGQHGKNVVVGPLGYLGQQLFISGFLAWFWIIGLVWLLLRPEFSFPGLWLRTPDCHDHCDARQALLSPQMYIHTSLQPGAYKLKLGPADSVWDEL